ncbi:MAG TPA: PrgI family protein [Candidatus Moranbacteria bacterium]|nr:PrgI family protein [Candidatus Moranbacteria bacterium]
MDRLRLATLVLAADGWMDRLRLAKAELFAADGRRGRTAIAVDERRRKEERVAICQNDKERKICYNEFRLPGASRFGLLILDNFMLFSVPQYINVEDKIAGPLTAKQLGWMIVMTVVLVLIYGIFEFYVFLAVGIPVALFFLAMAFYRPGGVSMLSYLSYLLIYLLHPKVYVWKRTADGFAKRKQRAVKAESEKRIKPIRNEPLTPDDLVALAQTLDSRGRERSEEFLRIIERARRRVKPMKR